MENDIYLSIVIPAYKEEKRVHKILEAIQKYVSEKDFVCEVIVVCDGTPDNTASAAEVFANKFKHFKVIDNKTNAGKGGAVRDGIVAANGKYIIFADADNSTPIEQVDKLLKYVEKYQVVIGSRYCRGGKLAVPQSLVRRVGSRGLNLLIQTLAIPGIKDTQCGFKLFERNAAQEIFKRQTISDFSFDIEILAIAKKLGYKIKEAGVIWYDDPHSTVAPIRDGLKMVSDSWQIRKNILSGKYK